MTACAHLDGERALTTQPCARCGTFVCEQCEGNDKPYCGPCLDRIAAPIAARDKRVEKGIAWSIGSGIVPLLVIGWLDLPPLLLIPALFLGGVWSGVTAGGRTLTCILFCIPGLITPIGMTIALSYADGTDTTTVSTVIFAALGSVPGLGLWGLCGKWFKRLDLPAK